LNNRRTLLKSYIWNYVVSNSGKATLENSIKGDIDLELIGGTEQLTTIGKNLANPSEFVIGTLAGDTGNVINLKQYITTGHIPVIPGKRYSTSCGNKFLAHTIIAYDKEKTKINSPINMSSEMPEGAAYIRQAYRKIDMTNVTESDMEELKKVCMVNEGSTVLPYEPYTGGKPSPSPEYPQEIKNSGKWNEEKQKYEIDVKVTGKNLFDREKARDTANWIIRDGDGYAKFPIRVGKGNKATFSYTEKLTAGKGFYLGIAKKETGSVISWLYYDTNLSISNSKYTIAAEEDYVYLMCNRSAIQTFLDVIKTLQVEISQTQTEYEPYQEPQALTLTSDRPLTKWDRLVEQGGQYGWLYGSDIKTFESDVFKLYTDNDKAIQYQVPFEEITSSWNESVCYCNTFENVSGQTIYTQSGKTDFYMGCVHKSMVFSAKNKQGIFQSIKAFQEWIRNSGTYVCYKTDNKKFVPLSESEQTQLRNLHSYNGTTHINIDSGEVECGIKVTYKQKK
jgi:hypothetical protein